MHIHPHIHHHVLHVFIFRGFRNSYYEDLFIAKNEDVDLHLATVGYKDDSVRSYVAHKCFPINYFNRSFPLKCFGHIQYIVFTWL